VTKQRQLIAGDVEKAKAHNTSSSAVAAKPRDAMYRFGNGLTGEKKLKLADNTQLCRTSFILANGSTLQLCPRLLSDEATSVCQSGYVL